jgi:hypothetical protein
VRCQSLPLAVAAVVDRVTITFPAGRWFTLDRQMFMATPEAGAEIMGAAPSLPPWPLSSRCSMADQAAAARGRRVSGYCAGMRDGTRADTVNSLTTGGCPVPTSNLWTFERALLSMLMVVEHLV